MNPLDATRLVQEALGGEGVCGTCGSRVAGICRPLDAAALDDVVSGSEQITLAARDTLFEEGARAGHVFSLVEGTAKLTRLLADGREQVVGFRFSGDVMGYTPGRTYPFSAELLLGMPLALSQLETRSALPTIEAVMRTSLAMKATARRALCLRQALRGKMPRSLSILRPSRAAWPLLPTTRQPV